MPVTRHIQRTVLQGITLAIAFQSAALADINQTTTLQPNTALSLDTGATAASGGDLLWDGSTITLQGKATAALIGALGSVGFTAYDEGAVNIYKFLASASPIPSSKLIVDELWVVFTNGGNTAKILVTGNGGGVISLQFTTYIAVVPTGPIVTTVQNNSSLIPAGVPSSGIAPSTLMVIHGTGLAAAGTQPVLQDSTLGLPLTLNGASVSVTVNGVTTHPAIYYTLPAATPIGSGTLTVTYGNTTSAPAPIQVVPSALGISTYNNAGVATDALTGALLTYTSAGSPGETIILWGTGLGADPADSDTTYTASPHPLNVPLQVFIGGVQANIVYQGASVYPGVDVIGLTIPQSVPTGCFVSVAVVVGSLLDDVVTLPINNGGGVCVEPLGGANGNQIAPPGGQTIRSGVLTLVLTDSLATSGSVTDSANAAFEKYTGIGVVSSVSPGGCIVNFLNNGPTVGTLTGLDPGAITLTGPAGLSVTLVSQAGIKGAFYSTLATGAIPQSGGTFTFKGAGGADVGSFTSTVTLSNPLLTWSNPSAVATIDRSNGFTATWAGGNAGTYVFITGTSTTTATSTVPSATVGFTCLTTVDAGQFAVPSYILSALPAGSGGVAVQNTIPFPLSASGLDVGLGQASINYSAASTYK